MGAWGMVFRAWVHELSPLSHIISLSILSQSEGVAQKAEPVQGVPPLNSQWLVLRIGGVDFLHCWVANSIWLERAESLITK